MFNNKQQSKSEQLRIKSDNIIDIFTRTSSDLTLINNDAKEEEEKLREQLSQIEKMSKRNEFIINKINEFIGSEL